MPLRLSGTLTTPFGDPLPNAVIRFDAVRTSGAVLGYTNAEATTDSDGEYAINVEYGTYDIRVKTSQSFYTLANSVQINSDNTETDLNALLVAHTGYETLTPQIILDFQALRDEAIGAAQSASDDAYAAAADRVATGEDREQTGLDRVATGEDADATAADRVATGEDRQAVAADRQQTGLDRVATGEDADATAADRIATGQDADATAADRVATGEDRTAADESALEAKHWANYPIDSPVPEGDGTELSARHWADISRQRAVNAMVAQGAWDASTGTLPSEPAGASYWLVTGAANGVTINGVEYRNKDMLLWTLGDGGGGSWSKIDNTDSVTSVANKTGAVELTPSDVGADPAGAAQSAQDHAVQRANHTGTQSLSTISDAGTAASKNTGAEAGQVPLNSDLGTASKEDANSFEPAGTAVAVTPTAFQKADGSQPAWTAPTSTTLETASAIALVVGSTIVQIDAGTSVTLPTLSAGTDYTIYAATDGSLEAVDADSAVPADTRKVGGFHARAGDGDINPRSCWDLNWLPSANPRGMTLSLDGQNWGDIYLVDVEYALNGYSRNGKQIADGNDSPIIPSSYGGNGTDVYGSASWWSFNDLLASAGKRFPSYQEFTALAYGVVENQAAGSDPGTTQHQAGYRSSCGCEQISGVMYQWGADITGTTATGSASWNDWAEGRGDIYTNSIRAPRFSAPWNADDNAGSRASAWDALPTGVGAGYGARGICAHINRQGDK